MGVGSGLYVRDVHVCGDGYISAETHGYTGGYQ